MPHESTAGELIQLLSRYDPDTPVLLPMPTPLELPVTTTVPAYRDSLNPDILVSTTISRGRQCVLIGDQRQAMAELPDTEGTTVFRAAVLRELDQISSLTGITSLDSPSQPILPAGSTGDVHRTLNSLTRPKPGSKTPTAMILQGMQSNHHDVNSEPQQTLLFILTVEVPDARTRRRGGRKGLNTGANHHHAHSSDRRFHIRRRILAPPAGSAPARTRMGRTTVPLLRPHLQDRPRSPHTPDAGGRDAPKSGPGPPATGRDTWTTSQTWQGT